MVHTDLSHAVKCVSSVHANVDRCADSRRVDGSIWKWRWRLRRWNTDDAYRNVQLNFHADYWKHVCTTREPQMPDDNGNQWRPCGNNRRTRLREICNMRDHPIWESLPMCQGDPSNFSATARDEVKHSVELEWAGQHKSVPEDKCNVPVARS